jgi:hypothetical protein
MVTGLIAWLIGATTLVGTLAGILGARDRLDLTRPYEFGAESTFPCGVCLGCIETPGHEFHAFFEEKDGSPHGCYIVDPCFHPACQPFAANVTAPDSTKATGFEADWTLTRTAIEARNGLASEAIAKLIDEYPDRVLFNVRRRAVQIVSPCSPEVISGHFPLADEVAVQVAERIRELTGAFGN